MKNNQLQKSNFLLYSQDNEKVFVDVYFKDENIWLTQKLMSQLFDVDSDTISYHLKNIYKEVELEEKSTTEEISIVQKEGNRTVERVTKFYNLDAIISVGYRVNSQKATKFRIWATKQLKEYIIKGFILDDERLKNGNHFDKNYFNELIERVREIRTSERNFYQKITDIYATSLDYNSKSSKTREFFATVQNKMHFGIHGKTGAEIIYKRVDSKKDNLGITSIPKNKIKRKDAFVAKNYLSKDELQELNLIVDQYLSFAELQARNKKTMTQEDWIMKLDDFLRLNEKEILQNKGKISKKIAEEKASKEYDIFNTKRLKNYESDFDKETKKIIKKIKN
ncbi:virulence RhuM family protein [Patescibacteria group bacterium]|nr:virulence RhuM family protein [Patescibacteria group bacterium]